MTIRITGTLVAQGRRYITIDGAALIFARLQPAGGTEILARWLRGSGPADHLAAQSTANALRRGETVTVHCLGLRANSAAPAEQLFAEGVTLIELPAAAEMARQMTPDAPEILHLAARK